MRIFNQEELKRSINRTLDDTADAKIRRCVLSGGGARDWDMIRRSLQEWKNREILRIIQDPEFAKDGAEVCVEMYSYIDGTSPIPGFLNYEEPK